MRSLHFATLFLAMTAISGVQAQDHLKKDIPFAQARAQVIRQGWKPLHMHAMSLPPDEREVLEETLIRHGDFEVDSCSVDGGSLCNFFYKRANTCMRLMTKGERLKELKVVFWETLPSCPTD